jgi:negative regulator of sigma E activity
MTEPSNDQISAFLDDELSEQESNFLVRRFERDAVARGQAIRYTMIGCALRNEILSPDPTILQRRIANALNGAPVAAASSVSAPAPVQRGNAVRWSARFARPLAGLGIAASVALVALIGLRALNEPGSPPAPVVANQPSPAQLKQWTEPASYVVPQDVPDTPAVAPSIRLTNYLVHHGEYASGLSRTSVHSNVVGAAEIAPLDEPALDEPADPKLKE